LIHRKCQIDKLEEQTLWDLVIVGGGASGLGIAVDAASRGMKTALFEQYDFAKGTSSKSTKLVHGGVRYLAQGDIKLVTEALEERGLLARNARHLFKRQEFIIPNYNWWGGYYYALGLKIYDWLSGKLSLGASHRIGQKKVRSLLPTLKTEGLSSGVSYFDGQFDDARLALNLAQTAIEHGGVALNYMKVKGLLKDQQGKVSGVSVTDTETEKEYSIKAKVVVNATGIFTDRILKMQDPNHKKTVVPSQGVHLVLDRSFLDSDKAIMIPKTSDGRVLFIIPWHDKVIAGTTDTLIKKPLIEPIAQETEIDFILETINAFLTKKAERNDVLSVFSGLRPLAKPKGDQVKTKEVSRSHKIIVDGNLLSIIGGKWTTYRQMAQDVVDRVIDHFPIQGGPCITKSLSLYGNILPGETPLASHLYIYGSKAPQYKAYEQQHTERRQRLHPDYPYTAGQVVWAVEHEMARTVEDFLARRIRLLLLDARAAAEIAGRVAEIMGDELGMDDKWKKAQAQSFRELASTYIIE
jgi:glycerol-3-phosphate dehydrogenase